MKRDPDGFTLLEVLVAVAIISTAVIALLSLHGHNLEILSYDQHLARATLLAQGLMTRTLTAEPFPDPTQAQGTFETDPDYGWQLVVLEGSTRELQDEVREIRIRVFWDPSEPDAVRLATLVRKPE